jgi:transcriptional regulator with XRE-family HTH domain
LIDLKLEASFGELLRFWRRHRQVSQLDLAHRIDVSARHLSFLETGRAQPSRNMLLKIAEYLKVPFRQRNLLLARAGFSPEYHAQPLDDEKLEWVLSGLRRVLDKHAPYPAIVVDSTYNILLKNSGYEKLVDFFAGTASSRRYDNALLMLLSSDGLRNAVADLQIVESTLMARIHEEALSTQNTDLAALHAKLARADAWAKPPTIEPERSLPFLNLTLISPKGRCALFSTIATLGTPADVTTQELRLELFFPADAHSQMLLENL